MINNESSSVYTIREINIGLCTFMKPEKFEGYHESYISINGSKGFILQSPKLIIRSSTPSYLEFLISKNKDRQSEFYNIISHLEDSAIIQIAHNSKEWFNREIRRDQVETMFRSSLHRPLEINDPYILRINKTPGIEAELNNLVVCLIKIDGVLFGKNTSTLDMKVVQIKSIKTEKIPSEGDYLDAKDKQPQLSLEKLFYNDNVSVVPDNFNKDFSEHQRPSLIDTNLQSLKDNLESMTKTELEPVKESIIEKVNELHYNNEEIKQLEEIEKTEKLLIEKTPDQEPLSPVKSVHTTGTIDTAKTGIPSMDSIKCEIMKAVVENDFNRVKILTEMLK
jgi:hypothetical protein